jgi:O-antigen ligase
MSFIYPFLNFLQPGVLFPALAPYRPMLVVSMIAGLVGLKALVQNGSTDPRRGYLAHPAFVWLCVFVAVQVLSVYYSGVRSMLTELDFWYVYAMFAAVSLLIVRDAADLRRYVWGMMVGSAVVIAFGLYAVAVHLPTLAGGRAGAYGMYENHNDYTFLIIQVLPFAYFYLPLCRRVLARAFLIALLVGCVCGVVLSLSRGGVLALVLECGIILWLRTRGTRRVAAMLVFAALGAAAIVHQFAAREANQGATYSEEQAKWERFELWRAAGNAYLANPILGVGSRRFSEFSQRYGEISHDDRGKVAHNTYIELAADSGTLGFGAFLMMLRGIFRSLRGARHARLSDDGLAQTHLAAWVSLSSILFRALLDAKEYDWSFYTLTVIVIVTSALLGRRAHQDEATASPSPAAGALPGQVRPMIYGRR